jgi:hypothetical protein
LAEETSSDQGEIRLVARWGQERRLEFIDFRLLWEGRFNRGDLVEFFGISIQQASLDMARYMDIAPENVEYDKSEKVYVARPNFVPALSTVDSTRYLDELHALKSKVIDANSSFIGWSPTVGVLEHPARKVPMSVLLRVLGAIRKKLALEIEYQSMSAPEPKRRWISPHALANDGFRWHMRSYCHSRNQFADFVFARVLNTFEERASDANPEEDVAWHTMVKLVLAPHPALTEAQKRAIELDYGMVDGMVVMESRQALLFYTLNQFGFKKEGKDVEDGRARQVVLQNRDEVMSFLKYGE